MPTLGTAKWVVNNFAGPISLTGSMACGELQSLIQDLSTNPCFVSYFEIQRASDRCEIRFRNRQTLRDAVQHHRVGQPKGTRTAAWTRAVETRKRKKVAEPADEPGSVVDSHSSRRIVTDTLEQPTRTRRGQRHEVPIWSCSRWGLPCRSVARLAVRSYRTVSPLPRTSCDAVRRSALCCTFRRLAPPRRYLAPCPVEPGLSSAPVPTEVVADDATVWPTPPRAVYRLRGGCRRVGLNSQLLPPYNALRDAPLNSAASLAAVDGGRCSASFV